MHCDFLVIGSGISGLNFALNAAKKGNVIIVTKKKIVDSSTNFAQGGIAAVLDKTDNFKKHVQDTLQAGAHHNNKKAVEFMIRQSPEAIYRLIDLGVEFANDKGELKLTREGGHNQRRIAYVGDYTGREIEKVLIKRVKEHPNISIFENTFALDLITKNKTCYGAQIIHKNQIQSIFASQTIIATGGIGQLFLYTTNPKIATGDGIAMALRAGCKVRDMEFIQFHPTALAKKLSPMFLISETVRGEGAKLVNYKGQSFVNALASRDIVARSIYEELKKGPVYLDIRNKKATYLKNRFPQIYEKLEKYGYKMDLNLIPVTPAAHYECGGIVTDLQGKTAVKNLFAFGEVACTSVHGANRLASNSLLEALVFSNQIIKQLDKSGKKNILPTKNQKIINIKATNYKKKIKKIMWEFAGIIRNTADINKNAIPKIKKIILELDKIHGTNHDLAEARNMAEVSLEILKAAAKRKDSLGCHFVE